MNTEKPVIEDRTILWDFYFQLRDDYKTNLPKNALKECVKIFLVGFFVPCLFFCVFGAMSRFALDERILDERMLKIIIAIAFFFSSVLALVVWYMDKTDPYFDYPMHEDLCKIISPSVTAKVVQFIQTPLSKKELQVITRAFASEFKRIHTAEQALLLNQLAILRKRSETHSNLDDEIRVLKKLLEECNIEVLRDNLQKKSKSCANLSQSAHKTKFKPFCPTV